VSAIWNRQLCEVVYRSATAGFVDFHKARSMAGQAMKEHGYDETWIETNAVCRPDPRTNTESASSNAVTSTEIGMAYTIEVAETAKGHLKRMDRRDIAQILSAIRMRLTDEPLMESRNRKRLRPNPVAPWELRVGKFRVFYEVRTEDPNTVRILAIGEKKGSGLAIGGQKVGL
jgi:mRNA-degrading endonuclease RelE of RelBE toxin-antitoxin system